MRGVPIVRQIHIRGQIHIEVNKNSCCVRNVEAQPTINLVIQLVSDTTEINIGIEWEEIGM